jgi:catechol 2,3-dioxygenase-like lactoylglutathione lyase family enzyme
MKLETLLIRFVGCKQRKITMSDLKFTQQITFLHSNNLDRTRHFYSEILGLNCVRDQRTCLIFKATKTAYLGFCEHIEQIQAGRRIILTLITEDVDLWHKRLQDKNVEMMGAPKANPKYKIYHFFLKDPDGYTIEIQKFDDPL